MTDAEKRDKREADIERLTDWLEGYFRAARIEADRGKVRYIAEKALLHERGGCLAGTP